MPRVRTPSKFSGRYWPCPFNRARHPRPIALPIMQGEQRAFIRCQCSVNAFCPKDWGPEEGLTASEARAQGYDVLTIVRKFEGAKRPQQRS